MTEGKDQRVYAAILLMIAYIFAYADRQVVNVLMPSFKDSLDLTLVQASLLQGFAFSLFFCLAGIPLGRMVDRSNRRNLLAIGIFVWSMATVACGLSGSFWQLFAARLAVGVGEACLLPATASLLADYYPPHQRGRAITMVQAGTPVGSLLAMVGGGWLLTGLDTSGIVARMGWGLENWQVVFMVLGAPGLVLAALIARIKEPARRTAGSGPEAGGDYFQRLRSHPIGFASVILLYTTASMMTYALLAWAPPLFMKAYGMSAGVAGTITGAMLLVSSISAYFLSGVSSDLLMKARPTVARVLAPGFAQPLALLTLGWLYFATDIVSVVAALAISLFVGSFVASGAVPAMQAIVPGRARGMAIAVMFLVINLLGLGLTPTLVAFVAEQTGGMEHGVQKALAVVGFLTVVAGMILWPVVLRTYGRMRNFEVEEQASADPR